MIKGVSMYGAVVAKDFPIKKFMKTLSKNGCGITRVFGTHMRASVQGSGGYLPWGKIGGKYDIKSLNPFYFLRVFTLFYYAWYYNIQVVYSVFEECGFEADPTPNTRWSVNPFKKSNNVNGIGVDDKSGVGYMHSMDFMRHNESYIKNLVKIANWFKKNVILETCNEPSGGRDWELQIINTLKSNGWYDRVMATDRGIGQYYGVHIHSINVKNVDERAIVSNDGRGMSYMEGRRMMESARSRGCFGFEFWPLDDNVALRLPKEYM